MPFKELKDGETFEMQGSGVKPYILKNTGGVFSCSCPAWRNQSLAIERRTCKHLIKLRGAEVEKARTLNATTAKVDTNDADETKEIGTAEDNKKAPPLLLAHSWDNFIDPTNWWMSEKLDGVRAYWDGCQFLSRLGSKIHAPDWFTKGLPSEPLDGELWLGRKMFQKTVSIVRRQDRSDHWQEIRLRVFDAPRCAGGFEKRLTFITNFLKSAKLKYIEKHEHEPCRGIDHLKEELARIEGLGGEGLMLRQPGSTYEVGRSTTLLKVKTFHDAEAEVVGHQSGKGKHKGKLGALLMKLEDGTSFSVGTGFSDKERANPPAIGTIVTFRYQELTDGGVPRFPSFVRIFDNIELKSKGKSSLVDEIKNKQQKE